ncbi:basement membrane-specific heparan sulfate proteoglycan core protein-like [Mizuhopecten yessoensis]|uniref:basement membrane-specific heparan sulfate proteoglycan core protein-like n=1 Tax=Mizuhopecten yessoensis TaxID=6573 RepID=UPI000B45C34A|nr:basement membrane-specific heparan sulfate proteoglycan core protein-like [Mizuhopecten yessoensis]
MSGINLQKHSISVYHSKLKFSLLFLLLTSLSITAAVTLSGWSEYAVPGSEFTLTCDVPEEANDVTFYRRPDLSTTVGVIQVGGDQCYDVKATPPVLCTPDVCSCVTTSTGGRGTVFRWVIQPRTGDHGSVWFCRRTNFNLYYTSQDSPDYTLNVAVMTDAVTLTGSSEYAVPGSDFTLTCDVPEEANAVTFYRRPNVSTPVGSIQVGGSQCYNINVNTPVLCTPDVCSCVTTSTGGRGTVFRWVIQTQTGDHGSVWFCERNNLTLPDQVLDSPDYTLKTANGPGSSATVSLPDTIYNRTEGDTFQDITCTADCRPGCTFVWTKPDNTNFTASAVLSLGQRDRSEHGTYRCTARNGVGESTTTINLAVMYGPGNSITFQPEQALLDIVENQTVPDIVCAADCEPQCTYIWSKVGTTYPNPLSLSPAVRGDAGQYTCSASNGVGQGTNTTWTLIVRFTPRIVSLSYTQGDADVTENGSKSLICYVESYPPSTIQWYYKANNTVLLTTPYVLDSTYTLTTAVCLDTGVYTCSARNSVSDMEATRDIYINVLCKPRPYAVTDYNQAFDISTSAKLIIPAVFISNPEPSFTWTFQNSKLSPVTELLNGTDNFYVQNKFQATNLSAVSEGTRTDIQEIWFGLYNVTATNSQGSSMISFMVQEKQSPSFPKRITVGCAKPYAAKVSWKDGGHTQYYHVLFSTDEFLQSNELYPVAVTEKEDGRVMYSLDITNLEGGQLYYFRVAAFNGYGNTTSLDAVGCTVQEALPCGSDIMYITGLVLIGAAVVTLLYTVGLGILIRRNGGLPFLKCQHPNQGEIQSVQLSERRNVNEAHTTTGRDEEGLQYEQIDTNTIAKPSVYSEIGSHHQVYQNDPVNDGEQHKRCWECC